MRISAAFDAGNIEVVDATTPSDVRLRIRKDGQADFLQWFHFRVSGCRDLPLTLRLTNASEATYPKGWEGYRACASYDRRRWFRVQGTSYERNELFIRHTPEADTVWYAYFAPYSLERHADLVARAASSPGVAHEVVGETLDGREIDLLRFGLPRTGKRLVWAIARQHPGETMAEWWMEGFLGRLLDAADPVARALREHAVVYVVPNMNPDGSFRGHLRTNAAGANLNREWAEPSLERSPEVYRVLERMGTAGVDLCLDVHGDEALPFNFLAGPHGIPSLTERQSAAFEALRTRLAVRNPDFQTERGYPEAPPGKANMTMCTNAVAERFGCLAATLEMPFKDAANHPDRDVGWSPERSDRMGRACVGAIWDVLGQLR